MAVPGVPIVRIGSALLCVFQSGLSDRIAEESQRQLLAQIERSGATQVLLDISSLDEVDTYTAHVLVDTADMARLMGARTVLVGMRPEVAATLAHMGEALVGLETALNVDQGFALLATKRARR
ncbi:anti-anti-sigma factor [Deltaproteobacteria bacterium]|nr:anti-anti-sigma factor [Deltaproteobacteria bacterium]